ncbi:zinc-binding dehydrogenase [Algimonas porphyrae]|uniref:NADP-dependent oxidoreductase n=1 Tax=Algimonas porphyrae TaxID=1128113 RepID=A0ABQ5UXX5_9PROT|nr:NADP-dependent oxidoreductase [Algimonas porphyrae]GLQ19585.1 NADP-dependent oxidoreductase [Algimonas porphyrae]
MTRPSRRQAWGVAQRPVGKPKPDDFLFKEEPIRAIEAGEVLLETLYLGIAPVMRMYMMDAAKAGIVTGEAPLDIGDTIHGRGVARVLESRHPDYAVGDVVQGQLGWQTHKISAMTAGERFLRVTEHDLSYALAVRILSMTGLTAYTSYRYRCDPKPGETLLVSGAAGGVGHMIVQLAKADGLCVIGLAGGPEKCAIVRGLGADAVIDYKNEDVGVAIDSHAPDGLDIYYDNVGGEILMAALDRLAMGARVLLCGSISEYGRAESFGLTNYTRLRRAEADMRGYFVYNHLHRFDETVCTLSSMIRAGTLKPLVDELIGFDKMPEALIGVYDGKNVGTRCVRVTA